MAKKLIFTFTAFVLTSIFFSTKAQDATFSQFYANPTYLNPALAGSGICPRVSLNYRNQWPGIGKFITYSASYDQYVPWLSGGFAVNVFNDLAGTGELTNQYVSLQYSYHFQVNKKLAINDGLEAAYRNRGIKWQNLTFGDQIDPTYGFIYETQEDIVNYAENKNAPDFASGFVGYGSINDKFDYYFGFAAHHITQPDLGFLGESRLPMKITANLGATFPLNPFGRYKTATGNRPKNAATLSPNILFQKQQDFMQINYGLYAVKGPIVGGLWLRQGSENVDAFIILLGIEQNSWKFGYSYDVTLSSLLNSNTRGSHEISMGYRLPCRYKGKNYQTINCPTF